MSSAAEAPPAPTRSDPAPLSRNRAIAVWALVAVASLLLLVASLTIWVKRQALDTDSWTNASGEMLANDEIRQQLSIYLVDRVFTSTDATTRIQEALPPERAALAPIIAGALRNVSVTLANRLLETPQAQKLWEEANRQAHENLLAVLEGKSVRRFDTADGTVVLDLSTIAQQLSDRLGLQVPPDAGKITILDSGELKSAQRTLKVIKVLSAFLIVLVLFLYGLAIYLSRGHRRRVLRAVAAGFLFIGVLILLVQNVGGTWVIDNLVKTDAQRPAGQAAWTIGTALLREVAFAIILYGAVGLFAAWVAGPTRLAVAARKRLAPVFREQPWVVYTAVAFLFLLAIAWGPTPATREWWGILILGALIFLGVAALQRKTVNEFSGAAKA